MLLGSIAAMVLLSQAQETSCGWEYNRWVCRTPAPVSQIDSNAAQRGLTTGFDDARRIDEARRARDVPAEAPYNPPAPVYTGPQQAELAALPRVPVTPNDLYVGCYLLVRDASASQDFAGRPANFSPEMCGLATLVAMRDRMGPRPAEDQTMIFCLPSTSEVASNPRDAMANAYLDFYDEHSPQRHTQDGMLAFIAAMIDRWPCSG